MGPLALVLLFKEPEKPKEPEEDAAAQDGDRLAEQGRRPQRAGNTSGWRPGGRRGARPTGRAAGDEGSGIWGAGCGAETSTRSSSCQPELAISQGAPFAAGPASAGSGGERRGAAAQLANPPLTNARGYE